MISADKAIGLTVRQHLFALNMTIASLAPVLNISPATVSRKLRGQVTWTATELLLVSTFLDVVPGALMPTPDGMGGWTPAPYVPGNIKNPTPVGVGSSEVVAGTGFEPAASGL